MSNPCLATTCLNGNCVGCRSGAVWCDDPRCFPNCPNCPNTSSNNNSWLVTIILVLLGVLLVIAFIIGYSWYRDRQKASEPKRVTVNKHNHTIVPAPIVVTSVASAPPVVTSPAVVAPVVTSPTVVAPVPVANCKANITPAETLSYSGMKFSLN